MPRPAESLLALSARFFASAANVPGRTIAPRLLPTEVLCSTDNYRSPSRLMDAVVRAESLEVFATRVLTPSASAIILAVQKRFPDRATYAVGGAVRDGIEYGVEARERARDVDLVTEATYEELSMVFRSRMKLVGKRFPVALIQCKGEVVEVASFDVKHESAEDDNDGDEESEDAPRTPSGDVDYDKILRRRRAMRLERSGINDDGDGVKDVVEADEGDRKATSFRGSSREVSWKLRQEMDAKRLGAAMDNSRRRDFTVNALYYDPFRNEILDFFHGVDDIIAGVVRTVGDTHTSLREDPVRMLRAVRLAGRHGFKMTKELRAGLRAYAVTLKTADSGRVYSEIRTLMSMGHGETTMKLLYYSTLLKYVFPVQNDFLSKLLPPMRQLTDDLSPELFYESKLDVNGGARTFFSALKEYDNYVKSLPMREQLDELSRPVANFHAMIIAPIVMARLWEHEAFKSAATTLPEPWRAGNTAKDDPELYAKWEAFTSVVLDVIDEMSTVETTESRAGFPRYPHALKPRMSALPTLLVLLAHGPVLADVMLVDESLGESKTFKWLSVDFSATAHGDRIRERARNVSDGKLLTVSISRADAEIVRRCLERCSRLSAASSAQTENLPQ